MPSKIRFFKVYDNNVNTTASDAKDLNVVRILKSGRDALPFPKWFDVKSNSVVYITCSVISFNSLSGDKYYLVWPYNRDAELIGHWDELKNETIIDSARGVKNIALFCGDGKTLLKTFEIQPAVNVKPVVKYWATSCPGDDTIIQCWSIPRLPTLGTSEPLAPKSTEMFGTCVDIPALPRLL